MSCPNKCAGGSGNIGVSWRGVWDPLLVQTPFCYTLALTYQTPNTVVTTLFSHALLNLNPHSRHINAQGVVATLESGLLRKPDPNVTPTPLSWRGVWM